MNMLRMRNALEVALGAFLDDHSENSPSLHRVFIAESMSIKSWRLEDENRQDFIDCPTRLKEHDHNDYLVVPKAAVNSVDLKVYSRRYICRATQR